MLTSPNKSNFSIQTTGVHVHHSSLVQSPIEPSTDIVTFINGEGILTYITPSITPVLGYAPEECINQPLLTLVHTDDLDTTQNLLKKVGEEPAHGLYTEHRLRHKDGSWRWFEFHGTNLLQVAGVGTIVGVFHDITEQKSTLSLEEGREGSAEHIIQFYKDDTFLLDVLSEFIDTGLRAGDACIVVGTPIHRAELEARLHTNGLELTSARL